MIKTSRLILRHWQESDLHPFALLNEDIRVMEYFPAPLSKEESDQLAMRIQNKMNDNGWGFWAVSLDETGEFIGFIGLNEILPSDFPAPFTPAVEIGWRLSYPFWNKGYATEGAKAALQYGFETLKLGEIVAYTAVDNLRSRQVMEKIGMARQTADDFDHPTLPEGHRLRKQVVYRLKSGDWKSLLSKMLK